MTHVRPAVSDQTHYVAAIDGHSYGYYVTCKYTGRDAFGMNHVVCPKINRYQIQVLCRVCNGMVANDRTNNDIFMDAIEGMPFRESCPASSFAAGNVLALT